MKNPALDTEVQVIRKTLNLHPVWLLLLHPLIVKMAKARLSNTAGIRPVESLEKVGQRIKLNAPPDTVESVFDNLTPDKVPHLYKGTPREALAYCAGHNTGIRKIQEHFRL